MPGIDFGCQRMDHDTTSHLQPLIWLSIHVRQPKKNGIADTFSILHVDGDTEIGFKLELSLRLDRSIEVRSAGSAKQAMVAL